jgi:hypothetical protein
MDYYPLQGSRELVVSGEVGSTSVVSRSSLATGFLASNEMSDYEGCTKEEGEAVC